MFTLTSDTGFVIPIDDRIWMKNIYLFREIRPYSSTGEKEGDLRFKPLSEVTARIATDLKHKLRFEQTAALTLGKKPGTYELTCLDTSEISVQMMDLKNYGYQWYVRPENFVLVFRSSHNVNGNSKRSQPKT